MTFRNSNIKYGTKVPSARQGAINDPKMITVKIKKLARFVKETTAGIKIKQHPALIISDKLDT
jgi:hypothetical protein